MTPSPPATTPTPPDAPTSTRPELSTADVDQMVAGILAVADPGERAATAREHVHDLGLTGADFALIGRLRDRLTSSDLTPRILTKGEFDRAHQHGAKQRVQRERDQEQATRDTRALEQAQRRADLGWAEGLDDLPDGFVVPEGYQVSAGGVLYFPDEAPPQRATYAPLLPVRILIDPDGAQNVELAWRTGGTWVRRTVPKSTIKSGRRLVQALGDAGIPVIDADGKNAERWLASVEAANEHTIPRQKLARWLGWQPDGSFLPTPGEPLPLEPAFPEQAPYLAAHHPAGTLDAWQTAIGRVAAFPGMRIVLAAGFAAALLRVLRLDSFVLDIASTSSRGKTTAARVALSPWADPGEKSDGMYTWKTKLIAAEYRLNAVRGIPVPFDESQLVDDPAIVDTLLYQVPRNHGLARGGGWASGLPWETIIISTGERPALSFTTKQGAAARVLSLRTAPMGENTPDNGELAQHITLAVSENYGTAGPAFITRLCAELATDGATDRIRARHQDLTGQLRGTSGMSGRRAPMVAALALADLCATAWAIVPGEPLPLETWQAYLVTDDDPADNRPEMALDIVREYIAAHPTALWRPGHTLTPPPAGWIGRTLTHDGTDTLAVLPGALRDALSHAGIELEAVIPGWRDAGHLLEDPAYRPPWLPARKIAGTKVRVYAFTPGVIDPPTLTPQLGDDQ
ncbi:hypothetical protein BBK14_24285 [Parafrankia soli]|uniref:DUF927 domain-containing protein n=1 Tax=Parafrankia soli TaxID=2599596 RepID=A0A1S1PTG0_9ACTN|nr:DUF927 domain-containing protein [Parafrankia soli]OHV23244.1 hypothetical protein BBK14_24285 [Parafrankia soli]